MLEDLGSRNGTFVEGQRIEGSVKLATTSSLRVARTELALELPAPAARSRRGRDRAGGAGHPCL